MSDTRCAYCGFDLDKGVENRALAEGKSRIQVTMGFWAYRGEYTEGQRGTPIDSGKKGWLISRSGSRVNILFRRKVIKRGCSHFLWDIVSDIPMVMIKLEKQG